MNAFALQCVELRRRDHTLIEIMKITGRAKSSIYPYIAAIPLSNEKRRSIQAASEARIFKHTERRRDACAKAFSPFGDWDKYTVSLVSHFLFDGEIRQRNGCIYSNRSLVLIKSVQSCMERISTIKPKHYCDKRSGVFRISYFNVIFAEYIKNKAEMLLNDITKMPKELQREFLRSFFDDEGCMDFRFVRKTRRVRGYQKNVRILFLIQTLLTNFQIESKFRQPNEIVISGKQNLIKFQNEINFSRGVRINGNRPNSIWKESLEKRELLRRAIDSFVT